MNAILSMLPPRGGRRERYLLVWRGTPSNPGPSVYAVMLTANFKGPEWVTGSHALRLLERDPSTEGEAAEVASWVRASKEVS